MGFSWSGRRLVEFQQQFKRGGEDVSQALVLGIGCLAINVNILYLRRGSTKPAHYSLSSKGVRQHDEPAVQHGPAVRDHAGHELPDLPRHKPPSEEQEPARRRRRRRRRAPPQEHSARTQSAAGNQVREVVQVVLQRVHRFCPVGSDCPA